MSMFVQLLVVICLLLGLLVNTLGVISLYRFKDVFMRMHGATKCSTLGTIFCALSVVFYALSRMNDGGSVRYAVLVIHIVAVLFGLLIAKSTGAHVLARAAYHSGIRPHGTVVDDLSAFCERKTFADKGSAAPDARAAAEQTNGQAKGE